ncbi:hypothetical protein [Rhizobium sp. 10PS4]|uniref:hypothetical protein n=1 Tax=Rhizobium sp. 10PS4 TaxID=3075621 RepID=UPI0028FD3922|nr:hypothetical protein [Rhizobium sp. 10PS4]MDU0308027.1 hypothetical protein [Rhizobium sp. 10PS4]
MKLGWQPRKWLEKKSKRGNRGYPMGTIAYYGPDNRRASKAAVSIIPALHADPADLRRWFAETGDLRMDETVIAEIAAFLRENEVKSVVMVDAIIGCPHEEESTIRAARPARIAHIGRGETAGPASSSPVEFSAAFARMFIPGADHASELVRRR